LIRTCSSDNRIFSIISSFPRFVIAKSGTKTPAWRSAPSPAIRQNEPVAQAVTI
jgi:hypothetical protein